jgi:hypothetical protein
MKEIDKELLIKDLSARLPYGVKVDIPSDYPFNPPILEGIRYDGEIIVDKIRAYDFGYYKPYLRHESSMTDEEKDELCRLCDFEKSYDDMDYFTHYGIEVISEYCVNGEKIVESTINYNVIDFFYAHHLDWRGLIPIGLALEAPEGMYKTE